MRFQFLLLAAFSLGMHLRAENLAGAAVTLPYTELKALIEAGKKPVPSEPPVPFVILSANYQLVPGEDSISGSAEFDVRSFRADTVLIPLVSDALVVSRIEPAEAAIVVKDGYYNLIVDGAKRQKVTLYLDWRGRKDGEMVAFQCGVSPAATSNLELAPVPEGVSVDVSGAVQGSKPGAWHLGPGGKLEIRTAKKSVAQAGSVVAMPAVVREANSAMRIVSDGTFFNTTSWKIRHNTAVTWKLALGVGTQVVSCLVGGRPFSPVLIAGNTIEIRLPETESETNVELTYTGKSSAFAPAKGEFSVALPTTELLVERLDWLLTLPSTYVPVAVEGNCEFSPGNSKNELRLRKELCRGELPTARVSYQKPETNIVREATSTVRIVSDGTFFNATTWKIRHSAAMTWKLSLGKETQIVSCKVGGRPCAPVLAGDAIELHLPESDSETSVELAYTGKSSAFAPVRGDFSVALPATELLVERLDWLLSLPSTYVPMAVEGNCEFVPGESKNELRLRKELCRGESPTVRVFYQKPETTKKP